MKRSDKKAPKLNLNRETLKNLDAVFGVMGIRYPTATTYCCYAATA